MRTLGVKFGWSSLHDADALDSYLYGSNAEWRFSGLKEKGSTPIDWITNLFRPSATLKLGTDWQPAIMIPGDLNRSLEVVVSRDGQAGSGLSALAKTPLIIGDNVALILPPQHRDVSYHRLEDLRVYDAAGRKMFLHRFSAIGEPPKAHLDGAQRQPTYISNAETAA